MLNIPWDVKSYKTERLYSRIFFRFKNHCPLLICIYLYIESERELK